MQLRACLRLIIGGLILAAGGAALAAGEPEPPADGPQTMIILDGSGSMWGRLQGDKRAKIDVVRDALRPLIGNAPAGARIGLMSFGHRRGGDCSDVEVLAPAAEGEIERLIGPLDKLSPRGKGPLTAAIREAAKALGPAPGASIILIHDNADNCRQDPCEAAAEIASGGRKLKINLVPLGLDPDELARSVCMAKLTGGEVFEAKDAAGVAQAISGAFAAAMRTGPGPGGATDTPQAKAALAPLPVVPGLRLLAKLGPNAWPPDAPVHWRILRPDSGTAVFEGDGASVTVPLEPGPYAVEAASGLAGTKANFTVNAGPTTEAAVALDAASLRVIVNDAKDGPVSATALVTVKAAAGAGATWTGWARDASLVLPSGSYKIYVSDNLVERDETVTLPAGDILSKPVVLGAGHLELTAFGLAQDKPLESVRFLVARDDPDQPGGKREVVRSGAVRPTFTLPAGTYYVTARYGTAELRQQVGIGAGDAVKQRMVMGLAKLTVSADALGSGGSKAASAADASARPALSTRIVSLNGEEREVARSSAAAPEFTLAAGRYRVEASIGSLNVRTTQDVTLEPGSTRQISLKLDLSLVMLRVAGTMPAGSGVSFEVRDQRGGLVVRTQQRAPRLVLAPGRYTVRLDVDDKHAEKTVDVGSDPLPRTVELAAP